MSSETISYVRSAPARVPETRVTPRTPASPPPSTASGNPLPQDAAKAAPDDAKIANAIREIQDHVQTIQRDLEFTVDENSGRIVVKVIDAKSKEVIREIPPEEVMHLARNIEHTREGTILKAKA